MLPAVLRLPSKRRTENENEPDEVAEHHRALAGHGRPGPGPWPPAHRPARVAQGARDRGGALPAPALHRHRDRQRLIYGQAPSDAIHASITATPATSTTFEPRFGIRYSSAS